MSGPERKEPDWERLKAIGDEMDALRDAGKWNKAAFTRLLAEARAASAGNGDVIDFVFLYADPSWL